MKIERFLTFLEKYLLGSVILLLIGLAHSENGMRGFPFPWLGPRTDILMFFVSMAVLMLVLISADVIARIITSATEPKMQVLTRTQINMAKAAPARAAVKPIRRNAVPSYTAKNRSKTSAARKGAQLPHISEESLRQFGKDMTKSAAKAVRSSGTEDASKTVGMAVTIIIAIITLITTFIAVDSDDGYDPDSLYTDDEYEESYDYYSSAGFDYMEALMMGDPENAEGLLPGSAVLVDAIAATNDGNTEYEQCYEVTTEDDGEVLRYVLNTDRARFVVAVMLDSDMNIIGAALCDRGEDDMLDSLGYEALDESLMDEDDAAYITEYVARNAVTAGNADIEGTSILLY